MINPSHALVFAMLSTASGWGLPSHDDSLLSPNESGVDGPRDRRQLQGASGSSCDYGCDAQTPWTSCDGSCDSSCNSWCNSGCDWAGIFSCDDSCDGSCDTGCDSSCDSGGVLYSCDHGCDACVGISCPAGYKGNPSSWTTCTSDGFMEPSFSGGQWYFPGCIAGGSCMSGNTGTLKAIGTLNALAPATPSKKSAGTLQAAPSEKSTRIFERAVTIVKELAVGDKIEGLDADKQPALCTVEAVGMFGHGALYGNYTEDHFVLDPATGNVVQHGAVGKRTVEDKYEVMTSCPVALDEAGTGFTPMDGDFCGKSTSEMSWSDYLLIHASMLRIVRATGGYWFSASAYSDFESVVKQGPKLCAAMLACAGGRFECNELERISTLFVDNYLSKDAREATLKSMPRSKGGVGAPGSVSFVVSQGRASSTKLEPTERPLLTIATGAGGDGGPGPEGPTSGGKSFSAVG